MQKYHHLGVPTNQPQPDETYLADFDIWVSGYPTSPYGIEWMRYGASSPIIELVRTVPHVAFEVDDLQAAIKGKKIIIQPNSPSPGVTVAFIEDNGAPIEFLQYDDMEKTNYRVDWQNLDWQTPMEHVQSKSVQQHGQQLRLVEYAKNLAPHWCCKGHTGMILEGEMLVEFSQEKVVFKKGDGVLIPGGEKHKHKAVILTDVVKAVFVEEAV
jgi:quercetin dioxygenase-like cupin family protein